MSLPWLIPLVTILILSLGAVATNYHDAILWKENQIKLDNAAIQMGQRDRSTFRKVELINRQIKALEVEHHLLHLCARNPETAASCIPADKKVENQIRILILTGLKSAKLEWEFNSRSVPFKKQRPQIKFITKKCPFCNLDSRIEPSKQSIQTKLYLEKSPRNLESGYEVSFKGYEKIEKPQFKLIADKN